MKYSSPKTEQLKKMEIGDLLPELHVEHLQKNPVFVIGHARSGTSILIRLLRRYLKINFGTETQFIIRFYKKLHFYGDLSDERNLWLLIKDIEKERCFIRWKKRFQFKLDSQAVFKEVRQKLQTTTPSNPEIYREILVSVFQQFASYHHMERWGDKTPEYILNLQVLKSLFPEAQYIHIVRDGRDVALSASLTPFGSRNMYKAARDWMQKIALLQQFKKELDNSQLIEIRYEDLLAHHQDTFKKLIDFLAIRDPDGELTKYVSEELPVILKIDNFYKWKEELTKNQIEIFDRIAFQSLKEYGYEVSIFENRPIKIWEKIIWEMDHFFKKLFNLSSWRDNYYKTKLRFREMTLPYRKIYTHLLNQKKS